MTLPDYLTTFWLTAVLAIILVSISNAGFSGGTSIIAIPLMA